MRRLLFALFLGLVALEPLEAAPKDCPHFQPDPDPKKWTWMDRDCVIHPRKDLDAILERHRQWVKKHKAEIFEYLTGGDSASLEKAAEDPLYANLAGAILIGADLDHAELSGADLTNTDLSFAQMTGADLNGAGLDHANLSQAELRYSHLTRADLEGAVMTEAGLAGANLSEAYLAWSKLGGSDLTGADFAGADLTQAYLSHVDSTETRFWVADLSDADLRDANLVGAEFWDADLNGADLTGADLTNAHLNGANLTGADLTEADLTEADLIRAQLWNAVFEPKVLPPANTIARADGMRTLRWYAPNEGRRKQAPRQAEVPASRQNQYPLLDLRKALHDAGYSQAEAQVNLAYHRRTQSWWQIPLFDWTCEWGADWARPIWIVLALGAVAALVYWSLLRLGRRKGPLHANSGAGHTLRIGSKWFRRPSQLFVVARKYGREREWPVGRSFAAPPWFRLPPKGIRFRVLRIPGAILRSIWARLHWEAPLLWTASLFSIMSILNLGVQGLDLGRWLRLIHSREFDLKARGNLRILAGLQSVVSFLLLALTAYILLVHPVGE